MKRMAALCGALLLTLVMAAPAAANQKVFIEHEEWEFVDPISIAAGWDFQCSGPVYYGGYGSWDLWMWYKNNVDPADMMPAYGAWPWIKGRGVAQGLDYFSSTPNMKGLVASGKFKNITHLDKHYLGDPNDYVGDPEKWRETTTGKNWGIQIPGFGTVFHESGNFRATVIVTDQTPGNEIFEYVEPRFKGNSTFEVEKLCAFFGYDAVFP